MAEDMTLEMRIRARGRQALRTLGMVRSSVGAIGSASRRMGRMGASAFRGMRRTASMLLPSMRSVKMLAAGTVLSLGLLAGTTVNAAREMEVLEMRLQGVATSTEQANKLFQETKQMAVKSPFEPAELIDARIGLLNIGLTGKDALKSIGDASAITQRPVTDLVSAVTALETEPLRRLGVQLRKEGDKYEFTFRDKMQRVKKITAQGIDAARQSLLDIFDIKYEGGMSRFTESIPGVISTMTGLLKETKNQFLDRSLVTDFVGGINKKLSTMIESGTAKKWGESFASMMRDAWDRGEAVFRYGRQVVENLSGKNATAWADAFGIVLSSGAEIFARGVLTYLKGAGQLFVGIGKLMAGAFMEDILNLPFMGEARTSLAKQGAASMTEEQRRNFVQREGLEEQVTPNWLKTGKGLLLDNFSKTQKIDLATRTRGKIFKSGVEDIFQDIPSLGRQFATDAKNILREAGASLQSLAGPDQPSFDAILADVRNKRSEQNKLAQENDPEKPKGALWEIVTAGKQRRDNAGLPYIGRRETRVFPRGTFEEGQRTSGGGVIINVNRPNIRATDVQDFKAKLLKLAKGGGEPAAATG